MILVPLTIEFELYDIRVDAQLIGQVLSINSSGNLPEPSGENSLPEYFRVLVLTWTFVRVHGRIFLWIRHWVDSFNREVDRGDGNNFA